MEMYQVEKGAERQRVVKLIEHDGESTRKSKKAGQ